MIPFYLITNALSFKRMSWVQNYPRHLLLAQVLLEQPALLDVAKHIRKTRDDKVRIILDNGAYEGALVDNDAYLALARELRPHCIVLPDLVRHDWRESAEISERFLDKLRKSGKWGEEVDVMWVPQGTNPENNLDGYTYAIRNTDPDKTILGLGKSYQLWHRLEYGELGETEQARIRMTRRVAALPDARKFRYHLLGARRKVSPVYKQMEKDGFDITGMDTYKPFRIACGDKLEGAAPAGFEHGGMMLPDAKELENSVHEFCKQWGLYNGVEVSPPGARHRKQKRD